MARADRVRERLQHVAHVRAFAQFVPMQRDEHRGASFGSRRHAARTQRVDAGVAGDNHFGGVVRLAAQLDVESQRR